ncbi:MAG: elongation factor P hydroxylase [Alcanivoracaceae bacterium]|nr:elongation factor P hydroxylase [Alcanivoracaceae bacterium]
MRRATLPQSDSEMQRTLISVELEKLFADCFLVTENTRLVGQAEEPLYLPACDGQPAQIFYTRDYFRSALHEIAHWCVAGPARRQLADFGYWYAADGRNAQQQAAFLQVELQPQALELLFCAAAGHRFQVSQDNLNGEAVDPAPFEQAVWERAHLLVETGLQGRAQYWCDTLAQHYRGSVLRPDHLVQVFARW